MPNDLIAELTPSCPKCGAPASTWRNGAVRVGVWDCRSTQDGEEFQQSPFCQITVLTQQLAAAQAELTVFRLAEALGVRLKDFNRPDRESSVKALTTPTAQAGKEG